MHILLLYKYANIVQLFLCKQTKDEVAKMKLQSPKSVPPGIQNHVLLIMSEALQSKS
jgi:hypothetical protein